MATVEIIDSIGQLWSSENAKPVVFTIGFQSTSGADPRMGQYACGSWWVAPAIGETGVRVMYINATSNLIAQPANLITMDADPVINRRGILNNANNYGGYDATENLADDLPYLFSPPNGSCNSLLIALQRNEAQSPGGGTDSIWDERVDVYCIITVLPAPPAGVSSDHLRPNITGATKEFLTWANFDLERIPKMPFYPALTTASIEAIRVRWIHSCEIWGVGVNDDSYSEGGRAFRAELIHDDYGADMASLFHNHIFSLCNNGNTIDQKKPAVAAIIAWANDVYHCRYDYGADVPKSWLSGAGQHAGKITPVAFMAALTISPAKGNVLKTIAANIYNDNKNLRGPQELRQIKRGKTGVILWGDGFPFLYPGNLYPSGETRRPWSDVLAGKAYRTHPGPPNTTQGKRTQADPYGYVDGPTLQPGSAYFGSATAGIRSLAALMCMMPRAREIINTDMPIEYAERAMRFGIWNNRDPVMAPPYPQADTESIYSGGFPKANYFGKVYGPTPADVRFAFLDPLVQGRYLGRNGNPINKTSTPALLGDAYWPSIMALYNGEKYENNLVELSGTPKPDIVNVLNEIYLFHPHPLATIRYTTNGATPNGSSTIYTTPFTISEGQVVKAFAQVADKTDSAVRSSTGGIDPPVDPVPVAPGGVSTNATGPTSIGLTINPAPNSTSHNIERSLNGSTGWVPVVILPMPTVTFEDTLLTPSTTYYYRASATNANGTGPYSPVSAPATTDAIAPTQAGVTPTVSASRMVMPI